jgi:DinB superfamily
MTTTEVQIYRQLLDEKYEEIAQLLDGLPNAALVWKPFEESPWQGTSNSLGFIVAHAISSTVYLLRQAEYVAGQLAWEAVDGDEGEEEFGPANYDLAYLQARVQRTQEYAQQMLDRISLADLEKSRSHPRNPQRMLRVRYAIGHAIEHLSQHIGHGQITRQLWALQEAASG